MLRVTDTSRTMQKINRDLSKIGRELIKNASRVEGAVARVLTIQGNAMRNHIIESMRKSPPDTAVIYRKGKNRNIIHHPSMPGNPPRVDSGELVRSILFDVERYSLEIGVAGGGIYGKWLEEGTSKMKARPWLEPAAKIFEAQILDGVSKAIEGTFK